MKSKEERIKELLEEEYKLIDEIYELDQKRIQIRLERWELEGHITPEWREEENGKR